MEQRIDDKTSKNKPGNIAPGVVVEKRNDELHKDFPIDLEFLNLRPTPFFVKNF
jgi:hypothetical protein